MSRKFIAAVLIFSATITAFSSAPARADSDDVGRFVGAAATLFILGSILNDAHDKPPAVQIHQRHQPRGGLVAVPNNRGHGVRGPRQAHPRSVLPRRCVISVRGGNTRYVVGKDCLRRHFSGASRLPKSCLRSVRVKRTHGNAYSLRCLRQRGYTVARR